MPSIPKYALITAARNEGLWIGETIRSVLAQTVAPVRWMIVSDGSVDATESIVGEYARRHDWIRLVRKEQEFDAAGFVSKVRALRLAIEGLRDIDYEYLGNLDADITLEPSYYEAVCARFIEDPSLGLAGGSVYDFYDGQFLRHSPEDPGYVSGAIQVFRRQCYEEIGGYQPIEEGGEDTVAVLMARMKGWKVRMYPELRAVHHRSSADKRGALADNFRHGALFCVIGSHPLFELAKTMMRLVKRPYVVGSLARLSGMLWVWCGRKKLAVPDELVRYLRGEQLKRMRTLIHNLARLQKV